MSSGADSDVVIDNLLNDIQYLQELYKWRPLPDIGSISDTIGTDLIIIHVCRWLCDQLIVVKWEDDLEVFDAIGHVDLIEVNEVIKWCRLPPIDLNC
jgi:hypothetical protein